MPETIWSNFGLSPAVTAIAERDKVGLNIGLSIRREVSERNDMVDVKIASAAAIDALPFVSGDDRISDSRPLDTAIATSSATP
jgi:hypothetical protein